MVWTPPNTPAPGITSPSDVVAATLEQGGASYRLQKHAWVQQEDAQQPYYMGFTKAVHQYGQSTNDVHIDLEGVAPPPDSGPVGTRRPRSGGPKDINVPGGKANKTNVPNKRSHKETTGEDPAPLFTHGQIQSRS